MTKDEILEAAQDKIGEICSAISNDDYCSGCKLSFLCKRYNCIESGLAKLLGRFHICPAIEEVDGELFDLYNILMDDEAEEGDE